MSQEETAAQAPNEPLTPDEFLGGLAAGLEDVLDKAFGQGKVVFTLIVHGPGVGPVCVSNCIQEDSGMAMSFILQQWKADEQPADPE